MVAHKCAAKKNTKKIRSLSFDARGKGAPKFKSSRKSRSANFCDVPRRVMKKLGEKFNIEDEVTDAMSDRSENNCEIISRLLPGRCMREWRVTTYMGKGSFGFVFGCRSSNSKPAGALKIQVLQRSSNIRREISAHKHFAALKLSPQLYTHCSTSRYGHRISFMVMSRIDTTLYSWLSRKRSKKMLDLFVTRLFDIIQRMQKHGVTHGDLHVDNIGFIYRRACTPGRVKILDHGFSTTKFSMPELEIVQFMRTIHRSYSTAVDGDTIKYLRKQCQVRAERIFGLHINKTQTSLEDRFIQLRHKFARKLKR